MSDSTVSWSSPQITVLNLTKPAPIAGVLAANYSRYQLEVPMVIHWPGKVAGQVYSHRTSHLRFIRYTSYKTCNGRIFKPLQTTVAAATLFDERSRRRWILAGDYHVN